MAEGLSESQAPIPQEVSISRPIFEPLRPHELAAGEVQSRKVLVPAHRYTPLQKAWLSDPPNKYDIYRVVYDEMKIDICMKVKNRERKVVLKTRPDTPDISHLQKCYEFLEAFMSGFDSCDAAALCRYDGVYVDRFFIDDVKTLRGEHKARAIGRLCGKGGKTKNIIENATNTKIVIAGEAICIMGTQASCRVAKDALCRLILGSTAGNVYSRLRAVSARLAERG